MDKTTKILSGIGAIAFLILVSLIISVPKNSIKAGGIPTQPIWSSQTPSGVLCSSSATTSLVVSKSSRQYISITNLSNSATVFLGLGTTAVINKGIALLPLQTWKTDDSFLYAGAIQCIASSTSASTSIQEII